MKENKNIEPEQPVENIPGEIQDVIGTGETAIPQTETPVTNEPLTTINTQPSNKETMEVHHHGHVHEKKKWKEYVFQFFMLFLAVFCGFLAEYQLEHMIEKNREKEYIRSMKLDLNNKIKQSEK